MADYHTKFALHVPYDGPEYEWLCTTLEMGWEEDEAYNFEWDFFEKDGRYYLFIFGDGDPQHVCDFLQEYLQTWHPDRYVLFTWANVCSAYRVGAFYGGEAFITANEVAHRDVAHWRIDQVKRFNATGRDQLPEGWAPPQAAPHIVVANESDYA